MGLTPARRLELEGALRDHPAWSDGRLAVHCAASRQTIRRMRRRLLDAGLLPDVPFVVRSDGTTYPARLRGPAP